MHWAHRIEDTNTLDVVEYYHLLNSFTVRAQLQQAKGINVDTEKRKLKKMSKGMLKRTL